MRRGWLVPLTRSDGRSLVPALAAFLFLATLVSGMHAGLAAAPGLSAASVLCHVTPDGKAPAPAADHAHDCCLAGSAPGALPLASATGNAAVPPMAFAPPPEGQFLPAPGALAGARPRAPPPLPA
jgi:hypothetical protein